MKQPIDSLLEQYATKDNLIVSKNISKAIIHTIYQEEPVKMSFSTSLWKVASFITLFLFLASEFVFATNIQSFLVDRFGLSTIQLGQIGIEHAISQGLLQTPENDFVVGDHYAIKVNHILMDPINLLISFELKTDSTIEKKDAFRLTNLTITNEKEDVLYTTIQETENDSAKITWSSNHTADHSWQGNIIITSPLLAESSELHISFDQVMLYNYVSGQFPEATLLPHASDLSVKIKPTSLLNSYQKTASIRESSQPTHHIELSQFSVYPTGIGFELTIPKQYYFTFHLSDSKKQLYQTKENASYVTKTTDLEKSYFVWVDSLSFDEIENLMLIIELFDLSNPTTILETHSYHLSL